MSSNNGRADVVGTPIQLGDFLPERREVVLNGQKYTAWVTTNKRYPRSIMARLDRAARVYNRVVAPLLEVTDQANPELTPERLTAMDEQPEAWEHYVSECVMLLIPNLLESEIELVSLDALEGLLRDLGYFRAVDAAPIEVQDKDTPPLTGDSAPVDSLISTQDTTPINS